MIPEGLERPTGSREGSYSMRAGSLLVGLELTTASHRLGVQTTSGQAAGRDADCR